MTCIRTVVGSGSAAEDLSGSHRTALMTSSVVSLERIKRYASYCTRLNVGDGTPLVFWWTLASLSAKNWLKASTSTAELADTRPRPSKTSTDFKFRRVRLVSFILVAPKKTLCPFGATVDSKDVIYPTCVVLQHASQRRIQDFPKGTMASS